MTTTPTDLDVINQDPETQAGLSDDLVKAIKSIKDKLDLEERPIRWMLTRQWKEAELMWRGIQNIFWSEIAHDWKTFDDPTLSENEIPNGVDPEQYREIVNIFRATGESIIAALTTSVPTLRCYPEDADKIEDITAARGFTKLSDKIDNDIDAPIKLVQILFNLYNFGITFGYNYHDTDERYGTEIEPQYGFVNQENPTAVCPECDSTYPPEATGQPCPSCSEMGNPQAPPLQQGVETSTELKQIGEVALPKSQECIEIFGPLHVRIPHNLSDIRNSPYLALEQELHYTTLREMYPDKADQINGSQNLIDNDRWARNPLETGTTNGAYCTYSRWWIRPSAYYILGKDDASLSQLKEQFPDGLLAVFIDNVFMEAISESLDEHWTVSYSPLSMTLNAPALGEGVKPIQKMRNELDALTLRTIKSGVPETFVDPSVVDLEAYNMRPAEPGLMVPAKARPGQTMAEAFFTNTPATLSRDVPEYRQQLDSDAQFVSGAYPSVYGGPNDQGSKTASEYDQSKNSALQRLSLSWKMLNAFWAQVKRKAMIEYRANLTKDENFVKYSGGSFTNVWIRQEELSGNLGRVETEMSDQFPLSWVQLRGLMLQLIQLNNPAINAMLFAPQNIGEMSKVIGWEDMQIPGENDRNKQLGEIGEMLKGQPVQPDPMVDNSQVHVEVLKDFLNSPEGMDLQKSNPQAYQLVYQHLQAHMMILQPPVPPNVEPVPDGSGQPSANGQMMPPAQGQQ